MRTGEHVLVTQVYKIASVRLALPARLICFVCHRRYRNAGIIVHQVER